MSKKASDILSRMKEVAARERAKPLEEPLITSPSQESTEIPVEDPIHPSKPRRKETVRITVDLDPELHRLLKIYALEQGVRGSEVLRALLEQLSSDGELQKSIRQRLQK